MPPKNAVSSTSAPAALIATLTAANITNPTQLDAQLLRKIYRLEDDNLQDPVASTSTSTSTVSSSGNARPAIHPFHACQNAWDTPEKRKEALAKEALRTASAAQAKKLKAAKDVVADASVAAKLDPLCTHARCKDNPRCLNWLGQALWEADNAFEAFVTRRGLPDNPMLEARDPAVPVGLKNLGATCYVNSYLQVWFRDEHFRRGVFSCQLDRNKSLEEQPLYHLQVTFAALQEGQVSAFNPNDLVKSLGIDTSEQQDAQEFAKLLMTLLEQQFAQQQDLTLKTMIAKQFEGKIKYGTKCMTCRTRSETTSSFKELEIPLKHNHRLEEQIQAILAKENLSGDNKYRCERCNGLQDAQRYTQITDLPPVLHFSLMRFGYDFRADERKKSSAILKFPKSLDMAEYITPRPNAEVWYDLRAILSHRGSSAYHGHYVAKIFDTKQHKWFEFDDETVTEVDLKPLSNKSNKRVRTPSPAPQLKRRKSSHDDPISLDSDGSEDVPVVASSRKGPYRASILETSKPCEVRKTRPMVIPDDEEADEKVDAADGVLGSRDAYMLVYVRRDAEGGPLHTRPSSENVPNLLVPPVVKRRLDEMDQEYIKALEAFHLEEKKCKEEFEELRSQKRSVYQVWNSASDQETSLLVDGTSLEAWLTAEIRQPLKKSSAKKLKSSRNNSDDDDSDCVEVVSSRSAIKRHISEDSELPEMSASRNASTHHRNGNGQNGGSSTPSSPTKAMSRLSHNDTNGNTPDRPQNGDQARPCVGAGLQIDLPQGDDPSRAASSEVERASTDGTAKNLDSTSLLCPHGALLLSAAARVKRVSQAGVAALLASGATIRPEFTTSDSLCRICVWEPFADRSYVYAHKRKVADFQRLHSSSHANPTWLSKAWLSDWLRDRPAMHQSGDDQDLAPDSEPYIRDVLCEHGHLQPNEGVRELITDRQTHLLQALFRGWRAVSRQTPECDVCKQKHDVLLSEQANLRNHAKLEKNNRELKRISASHEYKQVEMTATRQGEAVRAVPKEWMSAWRRWLKQPVTAPRPSKLDLRTLLCDHALLTSDLNVAEDRNGFEMILLSEWDALVGIYGSKKGLEIAVLRSGKGKFDTDPAPCETCRYKKLSQFNKIEIHIEYLLPDDLDPQTDLPKFEEPIDVPSREPSPPTTAGTRRSTRARRAPGSSLLNSKSRKRRPPNKITVKKGETLKEIRLRIEELTEIPVLYQRVFFKSRELDDAAISVEAIGIIRGESLQVLELIVDDIDDGSLPDLAAHIPKSSSNGTSEKKKPKAAKSSGRPEGFTGTALSGFDVSLDDSRSRELREIPANIPGSCKKCTFINEAGKTRCLLCEGELW